MRTQNKGLLKKYQSKPCVLEGSDCYGNVAGHHIKTKGSGGDDIDINIIPLCSGHHTLRDDSVHRMGVLSFYEHHLNELPDYAKGRLENYLIKRGLLDRHDPIGLNDRIHKSHVFKNSEAEYD